MIPKRQRAIVYYAHVDLIYVFLETVRHAQHDAIVHILNDVNTNAARRHSLRHTLRNMPGIYSKTQRIASIMHFVHKYILYAVHRVHQQDIAKGLCATLFTGCTVVCVASCAQSETFAFIRLRVT